MPAYLRVRQSRGVVRRVPETPGVPDSDAGLRAVNARLRELLAERDTRIAEQDAEIAVLREHLAGLAKSAPKSLRGKSGRKPGRPKGQPGRRCSSRTTRTGRCGTGRRSAGAAGRP